MDKLMDRAIRSVWDLLPEVKLKQILRISYWQCYNQLLHHLDKILSKVELLEDESLFVELRDGVKLYAPQERGGLFLNTVWINEKSSITFSLYSLLDEQYFKDVYQQHFRLKKGDIVIDIGAHIGVFTMKAAKAVGSEGMVIAVEPKPDNLRLLRRNIEANKLGNVAIVSKGVWSRKDRLKLFINNFTVGHSFAIPSRAAGFTEVEVDTLDNILGELGIQKVDFIKMDIEGAEIEALKGMKQTLENNDIKLIIAAYHVVEGKRTYKTIAPSLERSGFEVHLEKGIVHAMKKSYDFKLGCVQSAQKDESK